MADRDEIRRHLSSTLTRVQGGNSFSGFTAAIRDAREVTHRDRDTGHKDGSGCHGSWLGVVGYMCVLNQLGNCFSRKNTPNPGTNPITRALLFFANGITLREANALYALRNSFAHDYSLSNIKRNKNGICDPELTHQFYVCHGTERVVTFPQHAWDGELASRTKANETTIDVEAFADLVECVYAKVLELNEQGDLQIDLPGGLSELRSRYGFRTFG